MAVPTWAVSITADRSAGSTGQSPPPQLPRHTPSRLEPYQPLPCPRSDASPPSFVQQKGQEWTPCRRRLQGPGAKEIEELGPGLQGAAVSPEVTVCRSCLCPTPGLWLLPGRQGWPAEGVASRGRDGAPHVWPGRNAGQGLKVPWPTLELLPFHWLRVYTTRESQV